MRTWKNLSKSGPATAAWLAGVWVLASGCAAERVVYVPQAYTATVAVPEAPPPPPEVVAPAPAVELPPAPPPAPVVMLRSAAELDTMVGPIALYPDPLLAQILPASTLPAQVVLADRYLREGGDINQVDAQPWDNSLKALVRYPTVLQMMDENLAWTTDLGQAFLNQPGDVMDAVQRLRAQARALGNLVSTPQETVLVDEGVIEIVPAAPEVIYVPVYQPEVVYVQPPPPGRFYISFGAGFMVGAWLNHDCDWHHHEVIVWHHDHPRPVNWWYHPSSRRESPRVVNNVTVVNNTRVNSATVWRPRTRGTSGDRGWGQPKVQAPAPVRTEVSKPVAPTSPAPPTRAVRPGQPPEAHATPSQEPVKVTPVVPSREVHTAPSVKESTPAPGKVTPPTPSRPVKEPAPGSKGTPPVVKAPGAETVRPSSGQSPTVREVQPAPRVNPPVPAPKETRPAPAPVPRLPVTPQPAPRSSAAASVPHPVAAPPARPIGAAVNGVENSRVTREASQRGQQSRETIAKPVSAPRPAPVNPPKASPAEGKKAR